MENKNLKINIREIVISKEVEGNAFCDVFVYEPENIAEQSLGNLCIVGEVSNLTDNSSYLINLLASTLKKEFYSNTKRTSLESLEAGLHKANVTLAEFTEQGNVGWIGNLHMACLIFKNNELHFSRVGKIKTFLIRDFQVTDIGQNLLDSERPDPLKTFANIASGTLEVGDTLVLGTSKVFETFSLEKIKKEITKLDLDEFASLIQESIEDSEEIDTAGLLAVKIGEKNKKEAMSHYDISENIGAALEQKKAAAEKKDIILPPYEQKDDLKTLLKKENIIFNDDDQTNDQTDRAIKKSFYNKIKAFSKTIFDKRKLIIFIKTTVVKLFHVFRKLASRIVCFLKTETLPVFIELSGKTLNKIMKFAKKTIMKNGNSVADLTRQVINPKSRVGLFKKLRGKLKSKKTVWAVMLILIILFAADLVWIKYQKDKEAEFEHYNELLVLASQKESEAEQAIVYQDFDKARGLLKTANDLSFQVISFQDLENQARELRQKIRNHTDKIDRVNRLANPKLVLDFERIGSESEADGLIKADNEFYSFGSGNNSIYRLDLTKGLASRILADSDSLGHFRAATFLSGTEEIAFVTDTPSLATFDFNNGDLKKAEINFASDNSKAKDIGSFGTNIYLLDSENNQIYKHARSLGGFRVGKEWIADGQNVDLKNAISLTIDGDIFVLKSSGEIEKYSRGVRENFVVSPLTDLFNGPTKIYTETGFDYLYILDPQNRRVVQYDKTTGELVNQYISEKFDNLKDVLIDNQEKTMYLLCGKKVFEVEILE